MHHFKHDNGEIHPQDTGDFEHNGVVHTRAVFAYQHGETRAEYSARLSAIGRQPVEYSEHSININTHDLGEKTETVDGDGWVIVTYEAPVAKVKTWNTETQEIAYVSVGADVPSGYTTTEPPACGCCSWDGSGWVVDLDLLRANKKALIQEEKKRVRDGGVDIDGIVFDTDASARLAYLELSGKLSIDSTYTVDTWKASGDTYVTMNATKFAQVSAAGEQMLADVFAWQKQQNDLVDAASYADAIYNVSHSYVSPGVDLGDK